jgi:hypothetical protein
MTNSSKSVSLPNLRDVLESHKNQIFGSFNCHSIGVIDSFDVDNQTAKIQIAFKAIFEGEERSYPLLVDCPVIVLGGSDASLQIPVNQGDHCLVLFNDVNIDDWFEGFTDRIPESNRKHDLSDGIALVGIRNLQNSIQNFDNNTVKLINGDAGIQITTKINLGNATSDIKTILENLIDQVKAIVTLGSPTTQTVSPASQAALEAIKTEIGDVFE